MALTENFIRPRSNDCPIRAKVYICYKSTRPCAIGFVIGESLTYSYFMKFSVRGGGYVVTLTFQKVFCEFEGSLSPASLSIVWCYCCSVFMCVCILSYVGVLLSSFCRRQFLFETLVLKARVHTETENLITFWCNLKFLLRFIMELQT